MKKERKGSMKTKLVSIAISGVLALGMCPGVAAANETGGNLSAGSMGSITTQATTSEKVDWFEVEDEDAVYFSSTTAYAPNIKVEGAIYVDEDDDEYTTVDVALGTDYTVSYEYFGDDEYEQTSVSGVTVAGKYKVTVTGIGSCSGATGYTYIDVYDSNDIRAATKVDDTCWCFASKTAYTLPFDIAMRTAKYKMYGMHLKEGVDYTVSYVYWGVDLDVEESVSGLSAVGVYEVTFTGMGNYKGSFTTLLRVGNLTVKGNGAQTYTGREIRPALSLGWSDGETIDVLDSDDYDLSYKNNINVGTATVTVTGKGFYGGTATTTFKIVNSTKTSIANKKLVLSRTSFAYNGRVQKPTVKTVGGKTLKSSDYTINYSNAKSTAAGSYSVTVTGKGNYTGTSAKTTYQITQAANSAKAAKTSVSKSFSSNKKTKKLAKAQTVALPKVTAKFGTAKWGVSAKDKKGVLSLKNGKVQVKKGAKKGTYTIKLKASVTKTKNYKAAATKVVTVKVTVK